MGNEVKHLLEFGPFRLDPDQRLLLRDQQPISLSPKAFDLLLLLLQRSGQVVLKDDLMKALWPDTFVEESNLGQHVFQIRKALGDRSQDSSYIVTVPGRGYRFAHSVRTLSAGLEPAGDVVLESHSRTRVTVEDGVFDHGLKRDPGLISALPSRELRMLPAPPTRALHGKHIFGALLFAAVAALLLWIFLWPSSAPRVLRTIRLTHSGRVEPSGRVLSDGARLYFTERLGGTWTLEQISTQGGESSPLETSVPRIALHDIDPSHSRLLVAAQAPGGAYEDPLWVIPTTGGSGQRFADALAGDAAWSPDGKSVAYCRKAELFVADADGRQPRKLFSGTGTIFSPHWSPEGHFLSFSIREPAHGVVSLWQIGTDGRDLHPLSFGWKKPREAWNEGECCGSWSPDGRYFVFRSVRDGAQSLWLIRWKSSWFHRPAPVQIYSSPDAVGEPSFSLDGRRILFVYYQQRRELMRYDSTRKLFVPYLGGAPARHLSFSHDGQWVAYENEADKSLWRSRPDGTQALRLTFPPLEAMHSTWSPDGKQIVFGANSKLHLIPSDGGQPTQLSYGMEPSWSPDGKTILLALNYNDAPGWHPAIYQMDWETRQVAMIPGSEEFEGPQWSPDGRYLAAADRKDDKLMLFDFSRKQWSALADGLPYGWGIRWSADSKYVYYQHHHAGEEQPIFRVNVADRKVEPITSSRDFLRADVLSYTLTGLTPDNSPLASLVLRTSDVYALELEIP